ncbi:hypothetical protein ACFL23_04575 [Patescibacteria group bacterium]
MLLLPKQKIQPLQVAEIIGEKGIMIFTPQEFSRLFKTNPRQTRYFLETYTKRGFLSRLKKDFYALKSKLPNEEIIANALYKPSYISLEYALSRYGIIPESTYTITSVTTKATVAFTAQGKEFLYRKIKKEAYTGYIPEKVEGKTIFIAEQEKALADYLYFVSLGRKTLNDRIDCSRINKKKVIEYSKLFKRKNINQIIDRVWELKPSIIM